ncbi:centromere protein U [Scyliorhinus canicula]|uniref:centromere protein U n=1 Tax=Scyliorhinus canicula TaxID=7830 RepID=UPI0018F67867|nr:centromere protein U [Scyliorhinus canicula]
MRKNKGASTSKGSNLSVHQNTRLETSKGVRSKKGRGSQTNKRKTSAQRNRAKSPNQKHPEPSPNLSSIFRIPDSHEENEDYGNPLHSTAVFDGESELNIEGNDKEAESPAQSNNQKKPTQQSVPLFEKVRTENGALTCISEDVEAEQNEANTENASNETLSENAMEPVEKAETKRMKLKTVSSPLSSKTSKRSKDIRMQKPGGKNPRDGNSGTKQKPASAVARRKSLVETLGSISKRKEQSNERACASAALSRDSSFQTEPSRAETKRMRLKTVSSPLSSKTSKRSKDIRMQKPGGKNPRDGNSGTKQKPASAVARRKSLVETRWSISKWKEQSNERACASAAQSWGSSFLTEPSRAETKRMRLKTVSSPLSSKTSKRSKDIRMQKPGGKNPRDGNSGTKQKPASAVARRKSLVETRWSISKWKEQSNERACASAAQSWGSSFLTEPSREMSLQNNVKTFERKRKKTLVRRTTGSDPSPNSSVSRPPTPEAGPSSAKVSRPEGKKRLTKNVTHLDVVLCDFEEIVTEYKLSVESAVCRKVIDRFFTDLKEEVTETIGQVQDLKNLKRESAKVMTTFNKTRKHFLVAQKELNEQETQLKHLQKEYSELCQKKSDLLLATQFLSGFKQLQTQYIEHRSKNPGEKQTYNISSLPALLLEARGILGAEKQLQIINTKLQQSLDKN